MPTCNKGCGTEIFWNKSHPQGSTSGGKMVPLEKNKEGQLIAHNCPKRETQTQPVVQKTSLPPSTPSAQSPTAQTKQTSANSTTQLLLDEAVKHTATLEKIYSVCAKQLRLLEKLHPDMEVPTNPASETEDFTPAEELQ